MSTIVEPRLFVDLERVSWLSGDCPLSVGTLVEYETSPGAWRYLEILAKFETLDSEGRSISTCRIRTRWDYSDDWEDTVAYPTADVFFRLREYQNVFILR